MHGPNLFLNFCGDDFLFPAHNVSSSAVQLYRVSHGIFNIFSITSFPRKQFLFCSSSACSDCTKDSLFSIFNNNILYLFP